MNRNRSLWKLGYIYIENSLLIIMTCVIEQYILFVKSQEYHIHQFLKLYEIETNVNTPIIFGKK